MVHVGAQEAILDVFTGFLWVVKVEGSSSTKAANVSGLQDRFWGKPWLVRFA